MTSAHDELRAKGGERKAHWTAFALIALVWLALDQATKAWFEATQRLGAVMPGFDLGILQFRLVHNTGMAWSMLSGATTFLGVVSLVVCALVAFGYFKLVPRPTWPLTLGTALVVAGGLGNAIDRLAHGYVVDFLEATFIDFPVFNVADIGVTCGFALILVGLWTSEGFLADGASESDSNDSNDSNGSEGA